MKIKTALQSAVVLLALSSVAYAEPNHADETHQAREQHHQLNRDHFRRDRADHFRHHPRFERRGSEGGFPGFFSADKDRDGKIAFNEFLEMHKAHVEHQFNELDQNGDGILTKDELAVGATNQAQKIFSSIDRNKDGVLSADDHRKPSRAGNHGPREHRRDHDKDRHRGPRH